MNSVSQDNEHDACSQEASASCNTITDSGLSSEVQSAEKDFPGCAFGGNSLGFFANPTRPSQSEHSKQKKPQTVKTGQSSKSDSDTKPAGPFAGVFKFAGQDIASGKPDGYGDGFRLSPVYGPYSSDVSSASNGCIK